MKALYTLFAIISFALLAPTAHAVALRTDEPTIARKATARDKAVTAAKAPKAKDTKAVKKTASRRLRKFKNNLNHGMLVILGLEESKAVTSPAKLNRQLHAHQKHLKNKAEGEARARRRRSHN